MNNRAIRVRIFENELQKKDVASVLGVPNYRLSHWLKTEMPEDLRNKVNEAIDTLLEQGVNVE